MASYATQFGSLDHFEKGQIEIINDNPKNFAFSNVFDVASTSPPYQKVVVAKNLQYVIEAIRAEGTSPWYTADHDEFVVVMDGNVELELLKLADPASQVSAGTSGAVLVKGEPVGKRMGHIKLGKGHQALLPKGAAYRFRADRPACMIQQGILGALSAEKWADICYR
jgi:quercetin dioxygenase-like cupin family protein